MPVVSIQALAVSVLILHLLFILWVLFGALLARSRPWLRWLHIACLVWGVLIAILPWPCPLTPLENWLERRAGGGTFHRGGLLHFPEALVCPRNTPLFLPLFCHAPCSLEACLYV